jgi:hypothetical protein
MTTAAVAAASTLLPNTPQSLIFTTMTTTTAATCPSDFTIISESEVSTTTVPQPMLNKQLHNYSVFSLMAPIHLPTIANTGATQHTTNQRDLLHNFMLLTTPVRLVCTNSSFIECVRHSTLCGTTTVNGQPSSIVMRDVTYVPSTSHMLISLQQLLDAGCCVVFNQQHSFLFYLDEQLRLFSYCSGNLYHFVITFLPAPANPMPADSPPMALLATSPWLCLNLIHGHLGHTSERRC